MFPLLTSLVLVPLAGAAAIALIGREREALIQRVALVVSLAVFAGTLLLWSRFDASSADFQFVERHAWIPSFGIDYFVGVDGISLFLIVLTGFLTPLALLSSWESIHSRVKAFAMFVLALEAAMIGVFIALDLFPVLRVLGRDAHPDVFPDWDLGIRQSRLRRHQIHALHDGRQRADARRHPGARLLPRRCYRRCRASTC